MKKKYVKSIIIIVILLVVVGIVVLLNCFILLPFHSWDSKALVSVYDSPQQAYCAELNYFSEIGPPMSNGDEEAISKYTLVSVTNKEKDKKKNIFM